MGQDAVHRVAAVQRASEYQGIRSEDGRDYIWLLGAQGELRAGTAKRRRGVCQTSQTSCDRLMSDRSQGQLKGGGFHVLPQKRRGDWDHFDDQCGFRSQHEEASTHGKRSSAEACAKHLKEAIESK